MFQPQCRFDVHLKTGQVNTHIERSGPKSRFVQVIDSEGLEGGGEVFCPSPCDKSVVLPIHYQQCIYL